MVIIQIILVSISHSYYTLTWMRKNCCKPLKALQETMISLSVSVYISLCHCLLLRGSQLLAQSQENTSSMKHQQHTEDHKEEGKRFCSHPTPRNQATTPLGKYTDDPGTESIVTSLSLFCLLSSLSQRLLRHSRVTE